MGSHRPFRRSAAPRLTALPEVFRDPRPLLSALLTTSPFGVGIWDRRMRYQGVNEALAVINGLPAAAHLGQPMRTVVGSVAATIEPIFERVLARNEVLSNVHISGRLPTRTEVGHWITTWFPVRKAIGKPSQVGCIAFEVTHLIKLHQSLGRLTDTLLGAAVPRQSNPGSVPGAIRGPVLESAQSMDVLLRQSIHQAQAISDSVKAAFGSNLDTSALGPLLQPRPCACKDPLAVSGLSQHEPRPALSFREEQVLHLLAHSKTNKEIAATLALSVRTIETYRARLMLKLGLHSVPQLVRFAIRNDLM
jgi:DNA-binding CsgD family transcriptional regulator